MELHSFCKQYHGGVTAYIRTVQRLRSASNSNVRYTKVKMLRLVCEALESRMEDLALHFTEKDHRLALGIVFSATHVPTGEEQLGRDRQETAEGTAVVRRPHWGGRLLRVDAAPLSGPSVSPFPSRPSSLSCLPFQYTCFPS